MNIAIVGAGMAGLACADALVADGHSVVLFDKGRGAGGRMSARRITTPLGEVTADHGAQYFTARDPGFRSEVSRWETAGVARRWAAAGDEAWVGTPAMNDVIKSMASGHQVHWGKKIERMARNAEGWMITHPEGVSGPFDAAVLAVPAEQATPFLSLHDFTMARHAMLARTQPCWTAMLVFDAPLPAHVDILREAGIIAWAARNTIKPGRGSSECWVVQGRACWSADHIEDQPETVLQQLQAALGEGLGLDVPPPVSATAHRWRYAMSAGLDLGALWNGKLGLGVCGDWLLGPRVECAWLSGKELARQIAGNGADA